MMSLNQLSGEKLLLARIFGGDKIKIAVEREQDRRALSGLTHQPRFNYQAVQNPRYAA